MTSPSEVFTSATGRIARLHWYAAMNSSIQTLVPLLFLGSVAGLLGTTDLAENDLGTLCRTIERSTVGLVAVHTLVLVSYSYSRARGIKDPLHATVLALLVFFALAPFQDREVQWSWLGYRGLLTALFVALLAPRALDFLVARKVTIRFPRGVPPFIEDSMAHVLPAALLGGSAAGLALVADETGIGSVFEAVLHGVQEPMQVVLLSLPGHVAVWSLAAAALYLGTHPGVYGYVIVPIAIVASLENLEAFQADRALPNVITYSFTLMSLPGQAGCLLIPAVLSSVVCRSAHYRSLGRRAVVPATFGVGEMVLFGMPIMRNRLFVAPMLLLTAVNSALIYWAITVDLLGRFNGMVAPFWTPPVLGPALTSTTPVQAALLSIVILLVNSLIWLPSVLKADRAQTAKETAPAEASPT